MAHQTTAASLLVAEWGRRFTQWLERMQREQPDAKIEITVEVGAHRSVVDSPAGPLLCAEANGTWTFAFKVNGGAADTGIPASSQPERLRA